MGAAATNVKPGGETEALVKKRATDQAEAQRKATERAAERALGQTPAADLPTPDATPAASEGSGTA